ncbi:CinA family protein [Mycoplasma marinum]|uniref:CinA family protein n=1 Tax=Mycoplasma marinum TaxID=1937190 RepID=UPI003B34E6E5
MKKIITLGSVESFTGGAYAAYITSIPGSSKYYRGTVVTYATDLKKKLGVNVSKGVVNKEVALEMAQKGREFLGVDICVSFTGNAGPEAMENKPVGLVYIAVNDNVLELKLNGDRDSIRKQAIQIAIKEVEKYERNNY